MEETKNTMVRYAAAAIALLCLASSNPAFAPAAAARVGFPAGRPGALPRRGPQMEERNKPLPKERNSPPSGRKGQIGLCRPPRQPAAAKVKAQELVEREKVHILVGPL